MRARSIMSAGSYRHRHGSATTLLCTWLVLCPCLDAEAAQHSLTEVVWTIDVNGGKPFEEDALTDGENVYLPVSVLEAIGIAQQPPLLHHDGKDYFSPADIHQAKVNTDFDHLVLHMQMPGAALKSQAIEITSANVRPLTPETFASGFLDYSYSQTRSQNVIYQQGLIAPHVRIAGWSIFDSQVLLDNPTGFSNIRYQTTAFHDWPSSALRLTVGDTVMDTGELGIAFPMAGIELTRSYALQPGQIYNPTATVSGVANSPSVAQIYMNGVLIGMTHLNPGPFSLENLQGYGGLNNINVITLDANGNEQSYAVPYYFTNSLLKAGFDNFNVGIGSPRQSIGNGGYSGLAGAFSYLYGITDYLTAGVRGSAIPGDRRLSPLITVGLGPLGTATVLDAVREHNDTRRTSSVINYSGQWQRTFFRFQWRHTQQGFDDPLPFTTVGEPLPDLRARDSYSSTLSQALGPIGEFSIGAAKLYRFDGSVLTSTSASWSIHLPWNGLFQLSGLSTHGAHTRIRGFFASVSYSLGERHYINSGYRRVTDSSPQTYVQATALPPLAGGFGYRLYDSQQGTVDDREADATWRSPWFELDVGARQQNLGNYQQDAQYFAITGSLAMIGGRVYAAPNIDNAFAVIDVGYPHVGVYSAGTLIGVTGANGTLLVPQLAPYAGTVLSVREDDLPLDVDLVTPKVEAVPADGAGLLLKMALPKISAVTGNLRFAAARGGQTIDNFAIKVTAPDGQTTDSRTADRGLFELDHVVTGTYRIDVGQSDHPCVAQINVPADRPAIWSAGEVRCE